MWSAVSGSWALCSHGLQGDGGVAKGIFLRAKSNPLGADFSFLLRDVGDSGDCASSSTLLARVFQLIQ